MPVAISKTISIKDKDGKISILTETDQIAESTDISAKCDSSRCASRHDGKTVEIAWNIEEIKEKAEALPDEFFRLLSLIINPRSQEQKVFCSAGCVRDFLQYDYVAPLSPREEAVLQATNQQAELAKHRPKTNIIQFPTKPIVEVVPPPVVADTPIDILAEKPGPEGVSSHGCPVGSEGVEGPAGVPAEPVSITDEPEKQGLEHPYRPDHDPDLGPFFGSREGA
jgi:hypothetical protein